MPAESWPSTAVRWHGHWIGPERPAEQTDPFDDGVGGGFSRSLFRRTMHLSELPGQAPARISADSRYVLWVNGHELGRGPARSQPSRQRYDTFNLAPYLVTGVNVVAVLVTYYGRANSLWLPPPIGGVGGDAALVFEAHLGDQMLVSDGQWRVQRSPAWTEPSTPAGGLHGVPVEVLDARLLPYDWQDVAFDDASWAPTVVRTATHVGGHARSQPPVFPFGVLRARGFAQLTSTQRAPTSVLEVSSRAAPEWDTDHPVDRVRQVLTQPALTADGAEFPLSFQVEPGRVQHVAVDFGHIMAGFVELDLQAPADTTVELQYRERPFDPGSAHGWMEPRTGARYVARGGGETFAALESNGLRYVYAVVHTPREAAVTITRLEVREHLYPHVGRAYFRSDDSELDRLYHAGVRTVAVNSVDTFTDCPTREQRAVVGDGVVHQMVHLATNEDWGLARRYVELADSPRADGILPLAVGGDFETHDQVTIPDWSLSWIHGVYLLYWHDGDLDRVRTHLPTIERILRWYADYRDEHGTLTDVPEWNQVDWSSLFLSGRSSILTALWARALNEFAELSHAVGNTGSAQWAHELHTAAAEGFEDFWDPPRGLYVDHILDGTRMPAASQAAGAAAIVSGLAPSHRWAPLVDTITDPTRLVERSWVGNHPDTASLEQLAEAMPGLHHADWDTEHEIVRAQPFFSYVVHDSLAQAGRAERLPDLLCRWTPFLADGYETFGETWNWGTPAHGWSSTPTRDLTTHILGISPFRPGYARARIAPRPGRLRELAGAVPTPHGLIEVQIRDRHAEISSPVPAVVVHEDGTQTALTAGTHQVNVR